jgi:ribA/ribD-fused uncharacterized protein
MKETIKSFNGPYSCFSNFYLREVKYKDKIYKTKEHAFQCQKATNQKDFDYVFEAPTPFNAKRRARKILLRDNWNLVRTGIMKEIVFEFFKQHNDLRDILLSTDNVELIEGNDWGDIFWGVCNGEGENHLGKILMEVRDILNILKGGKSIYDVTQL